MEDLARDIDASPRFSMEKSRGEVVGAALAAIMQEDQEQEVGKVGLLQKAKETYGPLCLGMPWEVRRLVWEEGYMGRKNRSLEDKRQMLLENMCERKVEESVGNLVTQWVVRQLSECLVLETWDQENWRTEEQLLVVRLLGVVCEGEADLALMFWVQPLLQWLEEWLNLESDVAVAELGWRLDCLVSSCRLSEEEVHSLVDQVYLELGERDSEYLDHLQKVSSKVEKVKTEVLLPGLLTPEEEGKFLWRQLKKTGGKVKSSRLSKLFTDGGKVYVRKWVSEGFVSILRKSSVCYLWDIFFLHSWSRTIQHTAALAILLLIRPWALTVETFDKMEKVLLQVTNYPWWLLPPAGAWPALHF